MARWIVFDESTAAALASRRIDAELHTGNALQAALEFGGSMVLLPAESGQTLLLTVTTAEASEQTGTGLLGLDG
jgi:hypothetical protein